MFSKLDNFYLESESEYFSQTYKRDLKFFNAAVEINCIFTYFEPS